MHILHLYVTRSTVCRHGPPEVTTSRSASPSTTSQLIVTRDSDSHTSFSRQGHPAGDKGCYEPSAGVLISTNRHNAFASRICSIVRQSTSSNRGEQTR